MQVIRNHAPPTELTDYDDVTSYMGPSQHYHHQALPSHCSPYHYYHHHHPQCLPPSNDPASSIVGSTAMPPIVNQHVLSVDEMDLGQLQQPYKLKHKLENGEYGYTHVWQLENQNQQSIYSRQLTGNKTDDSSTFKPLSKATSVTPTPSTSASSYACGKNNIVSSISDNNNNLDMNPSYTTVNKPGLLEHPSLLQDHMVMKHLNPNNNNLMTYNNEEYKIKSCETTAVCNANPSTSNQSFSKIQNYYA